MTRRLVASLCAMVMIGGCARPHAPMGPPQKPAQSAEVKKLSRLAGSWTGTAEMVSPSAEEMQAVMPEGSNEKVQTTFAFGGKLDWALGGLFLKGEGWYEMGEGLKANYVEYWTWDPKAQKYRIWSFTDWGESSAGWAKFTDANTMWMESEGWDGEGYKMSSTGTMTFVDDNTHNWTITMKSDQTGKMVMKGTAKKQK